MPPHVFAVAEAAFRAMTEEEDSPVRHHQRREAAPARRAASKHIQGYYSRCVLTGNSAEVERVKKVLPSPILCWRRRNAKTLAITTRAASVLTRRLYSNCVDASMASSIIRSRFGFPQIFRAALRPLRHAEGRRGHELFAREVEDRETGPR